MSLPQSQAEANAFIQTLKSRYRGLPSREKNTLKIALTFFMALSVWYGGFAPALKIIQTHERQHNRWQEEQTEALWIAEEVKRIRAVSQNNTTANAQNLPKLIAALGPQAQITMEGNRSVVNFKSLSAKSLTQCLIDARAQALAVVIEAQWTQSSSPGNWDGRVVFVTPLLQFNSTKP